MNNTPRVFNISNRQLIWMVIFVLCIMSCSPALVQKSVETSPGLESLAQISLKKFDWMVHKNLDSLANVLHDDVRYIHSNGWIETKQDVIENLRAGKLEYSNINVEESTPIIYGRTGTVVGKGTFSVRLNNQPLEIRLLFTEVYLFQKDGWKCISRHACKL